MAGACGALLAFVLVFTCWTQGWLEPIAVKEEKVPDGEHVRKYWQKKALLFRAVEMQSTVSMQSIR